MAKSKANFVIDALLFLGLMAITGVGGLIKYVLPPGRELAARHGRGAWLTFLGWDRHDWGVLHLVVGCVFLALLGLHIALHWKVLTCLLRRFARGRSVRLLAVSGFALTSLLLLGFPLVAQPTAEHRGPGRGAGHGRHDGHQLASCGGTGLQTGDGSRPTSRNAKHHPAEQRPGAPLRGRWTLEATAEYAGVSVAELRRELELPADTRADARLGRLRREHGWRMAKVRAVVAKLAHARASGLRGGE